MEQRTMICNLRVLKGLKMCVLPPAANEPVSILVANNGIYESFITLAVVLPMIEEGQTVIDVGAEIGYYTVLFAELVGKKGHVYAFEPERRNFELLKKNVKLNEFKNVTAFPKAVADAVGARELFLNPENRGNSSFFASPSIKEHVEVPTIRLDDLCNKLETPIDFVKIDVEGAELLVLRGMRSILNQKKAKILIEVVPRKHASWTKSWELFEKLRTKGFEICRIDVAKEELTPLDKQELKEFIADLWSRGTFSNFLLTKGIVISKEKVIVKL